MSRVLFVNKTVILSIWLIKGRDFSTIRTFLNYPFNLRLT